MGTADSRDWLDHLGDDRWERNHPLGCQTDNERNRTDHPSVPGFDRKSRGTSSGERLGAIKAVRWWFWTEWTLRLQCASFSASGITQGHYADRNIWETYQGKDIADFIRYRMCSLTAVSLVWLSL